MVWVRLKVLSVFCTMALNLSCTKNMQQISLTEATKQSQKPFRLLENEALTISRNETITVDAAIPTSSSAAPIVLVLHGNHSKKEAHRNHILELAKNGFIGIALQFKNSRRWHHNGHLLARAIPKLKAGTKIGNQRIKSSEVILVGHSFGGYASVVAAGTHKGVKGVILLDPAMFDKRGPDYLSKISAPTIIIGADKKVFRSRKRDLFFKKLTDKKIELSVLGATHDDAQNPSMFAIASYGVDPYTSVENQELITDLIVEGARGLTNRNGLTNFREQISILQRQSKVSAIKTGSPRSPKQN